MSLSRNGIILALYPGQEGLMKIDPNMVIGGIAGKTAGVKQTSVQGSVFDDILKGAQNTQPPEMSGMQPLYQAGGLTPQKIQALNLSEQAIDMLDAYSKSLGDPNLSLKDIAPMVDELSATRDSVLNARSFLSDSDPLKGVMEEVASAMNGEILRFRRGDLIG